MTEDSSQQCSERGSQLGSGRVEESGNDDRGHELQKAEHDRSGDVQELTPQRFERRRCFEQDRLHVGRRKSPQAMDLLADQRPVLHGVRGERNRENLGVESPDDEVDAADEAKSEPSHRTDDDQEAEHGDQRRSPPTAAKSAGQPIEHRVKCNGQYRAPKRHREERTDHFQRPVQQQSEQTNPDRSVDGQGRDQRWGAILVFLSGHR
jgi:hypothetical protein